MKATMLGSGFLMVALLVNAETINEVQVRLDQADPGAVVRLEPGVYTGTLTVPDGVMLWGAGAESTTLDGEGAEVILRLGKDAAVGAMTVRNGAIGVHNDGHYIGVFECDFSGLRRAAVWLQSGSAVIANNRIQGADKVGTGIFCLSANPVIANNLIEDLAFGVRVYQNYIPALLGNVFRNNRIALDVGTDAKVVLQGNRWSGNETAARGWTLPEGTDLNADTSDMVLVRGMEPRDYRHMMNASYESVVGQHPAVIYELAPQPGAFDVTLLFPWATFSIGASAEDTLVADHFAYDWVEPRELASRLEMPGEGRPWVHVENPEITDKGLDRYVLENRFVHPASYQMDEAGRLVFERMTTLSRIEILPPEGYEVLDSNYAYEPIEDGNRVGLRISDMGETRIKAVFGPRP